MVDEAIMQVRRFNRVVTERIGAPSDEYMGRDRPLGEARVLWEIGPDSSAIARLRARLELDSGYFSRLLRALEADGLSEVVQDSQDRRSRIARLTARGGRSARRSMPALMSSRVHCCDLSARPSGIDSLRRWARSSASSP